MVRRSPAEYLLFFLFLALLLAPCDAAAASQAPRKNVLLLTSYHQGDRWNDSIVQGFREALGSLESVSLSIENLDLRRYNDQVHTQMTTEFIRSKYQGRPQDLILVSDDPALNFLLTIREELFPNTPVVFCGVNNFTPKAIQGQHNITGINEALSLEATLELALKLFPKTTRVMAVVSDTEPSGRANLEHYRAVAARMKSRVQSFDLGDGALGGYVSSGQDQGRTAGNLAIRILEGQEAEQIPVIMESPNVPMFDYKVLERFGIKRSALPKGSVVLNHQVSMWEQYWGWLLGVSLFPRHHRAQAGRRATSKIRGTISKSL